MTSSSSREEDAIFTRSGIHAGTEDRGPKRSGRRSTKIGRYGSACAEGGGFCSKKKIVTHERVTEDHPST
jgi:hypothetical protein